LDSFRNKVVSNVWKQETPPEPKQINDKIALGVLLWVVAEADSRFLSKEEEKIKDVLTKFCKVSQEDLDIILSSIKEAAVERIDLYRFTNEVGSDLDHVAKIRIIEILFRVACVDKDLDNEELETIRKISGLLHITHSEFIDAKIKIKKECGLDTTG